MISQIIPAGEGMPMYLVERLIILAEECAEVQQQVAKIIRFGANTKSYYEPEFSNRDLLEKEVGDLMSLVDQLIEYGFLDHDALLAQAQKKAEKMKKWTAWLPDGSRNPDNVAQ